MGCLAVGVLWFMKHTFLHVDYAFAAPPVSLSFLAALLLLNLFVTLSLPGVLVRRNVKALCGVLFVLQAAVMAFSEWLLAMDALPFYSPLFLPVTIVGGIWATNQCAIVYLLHFSLNQSVSERRHCPCARLARRGLPRR